MRGEWIEIQRFYKSQVFTYESSLPMRGEWIEIIMKINVENIKNGLSPCGESGLKLPGTRPADAGRVSPHAGRVD